MNPEENNNDDLTENPDTSEQKDNEVNIDSQEKTNQSIDHNQDRPEEVLVSIPIAQEKPSIPKKIIYKSKFPWWKFRFNAMYLIVPIIFYGLYSFTKDYYQVSVTFYGFAENRETEINLDHPILIKKVLVTPGQFVSQGDLLLEAEFTELGKKLDAFSSDIKILNAESKARITAIQAEIKILESEKIVNTSDINIKIKDLEAKKELSQKLLKSLTSVDIKTSDTPTSFDIQIESLKKELNTINLPLDSEIHRLEKELSSINNPLNLQIGQLKNEISYYEREQKKLSVFAPGDGLIGNVHCKEGENISSFNSLISFYERTPTLVKGYVHENLILKVSIGDTLIINSSMRGNHNSEGVVMGLGSRIVEIPERLRKIPEIKTYGREILIGIPSDNPFLQKEKVVLNLKGNEKENSFIDYINSLTSDQFTSD